MIKMPDDLTVPMLLAVQDDPRTALSDPREAMERMGWLALAYRVLVNYAHQTDGYPTPNNVSPFGGSSRLSGIIEVYRFSERPIEFGEEWSGLFKFDYEDNLYIKVNNHLAYGIHGGSPSIHPNTKVTPLAASYRKVAE